MKTTLVERNFRLKGECKSGVRSKRISNTEMTREYSMLASTTVKCVGGVKQHWSRLHVCFSPTFLFGVAEYYMFEEGERELAKEFPAKVGMEWYVLHGSRIDGGISVWLIKMCTWNLLKW